jgi:O-antigen ligase
LLLVGLLIPISYFACRGREGVMRVSPLRYALVLVAAVVAFTQWEGAEASMMRFAKVFSNTRDFDQTLRVDEFAVAGDIIAEDPFLGVGLGGYGAAGYGTDEDVYPHNLFLEAFAEAGIVGVLLFGSSMAILWWLAFNTRRVGAMVYFLLFVFLMFSYSKSGGFVGARDLYMCMGVFLAYLNSPGLDDARYEAFGLGRQRASP